MERMQQLPPRNRAPTHSALHALVQQELGEDLDGWLVAQRAAGQTWDQISTVVRERTNHPVSRESLRVWHRRAVSNGHAPQP